MEIKVDADILKDGREWFDEWHAKRNAAVAALVDDGRAGHLWQSKGNISREQHDDDRMRWLFRRQTKPEDERSGSDRAASPEAYLYEGVKGCMEAARADERKRIARAISNGIKLLLGDEFDAIMSEIADENDINIGYD